ncbi:MAG: HAD family hydrolase [Leeuwenhoekiella sp.]
MTFNINAQTVIVFDLDDTLYKEINYLRSAYKEIAKYIDESKWQSLFSEMFALYREGKNVFDHLLTYYNVNKEDLLHMYRNHIPEIFLEKQTVALLDQIAASGAKLTVLTDGRSTTQRAKIKKLGLEKWMNVFFISEEIGSEKPNEKNFKAVENHFNLQNYFYIADNLKKDFVTPNKLGWVTIALIDDGLNIHTDSASHRIKEYKPKYSIFQLDELLKN